MSPSAVVIQTYINKYIRTYPKDGFDEMRLNTILNLMLSLADAAGGGPISGGKTIVFTSADFVNATDCPSSAMGTSQIVLFWNEGQRYLNFDTGEFTYLPGGGFRVLVPGFDKSTDNYHFYATVL